VANITTGGKVFWAMRRRSETLGSATPLDAGPVAAGPVDTDRREAERRERGTLGGTLAEVLDHPLADPPDHALAASLKAAAEGGGAEAQAGALGGS
jgi:hypothetical protein